MKTSRKYVQLCKVLPEMESEKFRVLHYKIDLTPLDMARARINGDMGLTREYLIDKEFTYSKLVEKSNGIWMSDTPMETETNKDFLCNANGDVLIFGLGIGLIIFPLLNDPLINSVTIVELEQELIDMVGSHIKSKKVTLIQGDAFKYEFPKDKKFDTIYFDIWKEICSDNYEETKTLHKRYRKNFNYSNENRFMDSWLRDYVKALFYKEQKELKLSYGYAGVFDNL